MTVLLTAPEDERYRSIRAKDAAWDGRFVFAVRTTGVFCRPSCPARTPRAHNVEYFDNPAAAVAAGYRACLRCRPEQASQVQVPWLEAVCRYIEAADHKPALAELANVAGVSVSAFQRTFTAALGVSPKEYARALRHDRLREGLRRGHTVTTAAYGAGYGSSGRLYAESSAVLGMEPRRFQASGEGETIKYTIADCPLGRVLVARTERGVCAVALGDDDGSLVDDLVRQFSAATLEECSALCTDVTAVLEMWRSGVAESGLPLDIRGTVFQHRVWQALRHIPAGQTRTYKQIAAEVGATSAVRAVGSACAANRLALLVPCHRVVRGDGALGGFRWGLETKRRLIEMERKLNTESDEPVA